MNMAIACVETISEIILFLTIILSLYIIDNKLPLPSLKQLAGLVIAIGIIGFLFYIDLYSKNLILQLFLLILNYSKFSLGSILAYKCFSIKIILVSLIIQFSCDLLIYGLFIPISNNLCKAEFEALLILVIRLVLFGSLVVIAKKLKRSFNKSIITLFPNYILLLILINVFISNGLVYTVDFETSNTTLKFQMLKLLSLASTLCLIAILISLLTNVLLKKYYSDMNKLLEKQVQIQLNHYEKREKINTEIRRFKHDYTNHINCIKSLIKSEKYEEVTEYLNNISAVFPADHFLYNTGNYISDAILSDKQESVKKDKINISFSGTIPSFINNTDLCIILSNAIDNAIEACIAVENEKNIEVFGGYKHGYFILTVKNPTVNSIDSKEFPQTTKSDNLYHGFGLQNIKTVVEKYNGIMKIENKDSYFILNITLNNSLTNSKE